MVGERNEPSVDPDTLPYIRSTFARKNLFIPELERLLGDPVDFPLGGDFEPLRVRIEQAVDTVERRSSGLAAEAYRRVHRHRLSVMLAAFVGFCALLVALAVPEYRFVAFLVAAAELVLVLRFSRLQQLYAVDGLELESLAGRYRPELEACTTAPELRELAGRIGGEMRELWVDPRQ